MNDINTLMSRIDEINRETDPKKLTDDDIKELWSNGDQAVKLRSKR